MTITMYQASVPTLVKHLEALRHILTKGETFAKEKGLQPDDLLQARIAPDMYPLTRQVQIASDMAKATVARLSGQDAPSYADDEVSFEDLHARIAKTVEYLNGFSAADIDGSEEKPITLKFPNGEFNFTGQEYLLGFVLPNLYFHCATAYGILRGKGVPLGKMDFFGMA